MSAIEDYLALPGAHAHLEGFLALLRRCGTPAVLGRDELSLGNAIHRILINAVIGNTLTRHAGGFVQLYTFTNQELTDAFRLTLCNDFPCPSFLWAQILEIGDLRGAAHLGMSGTLLKEKAEKIYDTIAGFAPEAWTEPYSMPKADTAYLLASIFKAACSIYCCCSYPPSADSTLVDWIDAVKAAQRKILLRLVSHAFEKDNLRWCLTWPLAVLGYAVATGSFAERATVGRLLAEMGSEYSPMPPRVRVRLERFWRSGSRSWDQCWHEPVIFTV
ncbi:C6 finger domain protein [Cordyceps fumosorosea ARSEF 2679]|uniref:C6 finger domain protein n=1 Tax=Cordyceps fumosorosea (strain ARSEF 2679) TaxID=1081104 RepID=A0A167Q466_CORFA|nr:C6 finger domain protein [Cordyceps fumosorosea ARSEF 2679]OAA57267.1 C6 finger domain protein [Cordyceps fumosorosea ARSEF 2679]